MKGGNRAFAPLSMNGANGRKSTAAAAHSVLWRARMGYWARIDGDRYFVALPKKMTIEGVLIV